MCVLWLGALPAPTLSLTPVCLAIRVGTTQHTLLALVSTVNAHICAAVPALSPAQGALGN